MITLQHWKEEERPREKFILHGPDSVSDAELLAILIRSGTRNENAIELARKVLLQAGNSWQELRRTTCEELSGIHGIGPGKALSILAAFEIAKRTDLDRTPAPDRIYSSESAFRAIAPLLRDLPHEECWILYLNRGNRLPGSQDRLQTQRLKSAAQLCDIELLDHLIIAGSEYYSFSDEGIL